MSSRTRYYNRYTPYRSGVAGRARRQQRAADQQRDSTTVVINTNYSFDCGQTMSQIYMDRGNDGWFDTGCAAINVYDMLRKSDYFTDFSTLYDQFKVDNVRAKIIATNWATSRDESSTEKINEIIKSRSYIIVTAWDRSGVSADDIVKDANWDSDEVTNKKFYVTIGKKIDTYSSAKTKHLGPGNAYEIVRQLYPENVYERSAYISTSLMRGQQVRTNTNFFAYNCFYKRSVPENVNPNGYIYEAYDFKTSNPCNLLSDPAVPFKPTLLVDVISGPSPMVTDVREKDPEGFSTITTIGINKIKPVTFDVEFEIVVTFRGLRYNRNVDRVVNYIPPPVRALYPENDSKVTRGKYNIKNVKLTDSKYNYGIILNGPYSRRTTIEFDSLPSSDQNRYVVYLIETVTNPETPDSVFYNLRIINFGSKRFKRIFQNNQIYLFDFISDKQTENGIDDYLNIQMHAFGVPDDIVVFEKSYKLNVEVTEYENDNYMVGKALDSLPLGYRFDWTLDDMVIAPTTPNPWWMDKMVNVY